MSCGNIAASCAVRKTSDIEGEPEEWPEQAAEHPTDVVKAFAG